MFPPEFKPSSRRSSAATRKKAPRKSTRLIFALSVSLIGTCLRMRKEHFVWHRGELYLDHDDSKNTSDNDEGYLDEECVSPAEPIVDDCEGQNRSDGQGNTTLKVTYILHKHHPAPSLRQKRYSRCLARHLVCGEGLSLRRRRR